MRKIIKYIIDKIKIGYWKIIEKPLLWKQLGSVGKNVSISPDCVFVGAENIYIGNDVCLGKDTLILTTRANVKIGNHVMFGPRVTIITGDHRTDVVGRYMSSIKDAEKKEENDKNVIIEGDNWIGANATILKGVVIGRGSIIAAGALVNKDVMPYTIVGGVPAKCISKRFDEEQIRIHEHMLENIL